MRDRLRGNLYVSTLGNHYIAAVGVCSAVGRQRGGYIVDQHCPVKRDAVEAVFVNGEMSCKNRIAGKRNGTRIVRILVIPIGKVVIGVGNGLNGYFDGLHHKVCTVTIVGHVFWQWSDQCRSTVTVVSQLQCVIRKVFHLHPHIGCGHGEFPGAIVLLGRGYIYGWPSCRRVFDGHTLHVVGIRRGEHHFVTRANDDGVIGDGHGDSVDGHRPAVRNLTQGKRNNVGHSLAIDNMPAIAEGSGKLRGGHVRSVDALRIANGLGVIAIGTISRTVTVVKGVSVCHSVDRIDETVAYVNGIIAIAMA